MKIKGVEYDETELIERSPLAVYMQLKMQSAKYLGTKGIDVTDLASTGDDAGDDDEAPSGGIEYLVALAFLAEHSTGARPSFQEVAETHTIADFEEDEDAEAEEAPDPTSAPTDSPRGDSLPESE